MAQLLPAASYHDAVLSLSGQLTVRAVFERAWQLHDEAGRVLTVAATPHDGPLSIRLDRSFLPGTQVRPGMQGCIDRDGLVVGQALVDLRGANVWNPLLTDLPPLDSHALTSDLDRIERLALDRSEHDRSYPWWPRIVTRYRELQAALRVGQLAPISRSAHSLLGLGPGLTPSGDDIVCGLLSGLDVLARRAGAPNRFSGLGDTIAHAARTSTTPLSRTLIAWAGRGVAVQPLLDVLWSLGSNGPIRGIEPLLAIGHTSGRDMLAGAALAGSWISMREEMSGSAVAGPGEYLSRLGQAHARLGSLDPSARGSARGGGYGDTAQSRAPGR